MHRGNVVTQTITAAEARQQFNEVIDRVARKANRVIVQQGGRPVAAIVSTEDLELLERIEAEREERWRVIDDIRLRNRDADPDEIDRDVSTEIEAMRQERRASQASG